MRIHFHLLHRNRLYQPPDRPHPVVPLHSYIHFPGLTCTSHSHLIPLQLWVLSQVQFLPGAALPRPQAEFQWVLTQLSDGRPQAYNTNRHTRSSLPDTLMNRLQGLLPE